MHPVDCPAWEYENFPRHKEILSKRIAKTLVLLRQGKLDSLALAADSRLFHGHLFTRLTPPGYAYYAGHFRGESFRCLRYYPVGVHNDPRVGYPPDFVLGFMVEMEQRIRAGVGALDVAHRLPSSHLPQKDKLKNAVIFACRVFELFLRIHPYANGNGHAARFIVWSILTRFGFWPNSWPIEPRPPDPPYTQLIQDYRDGKREPLETFVLRSVLGPQS